MKSITQAELAADTDRTVQVMQEMVDATHPAEIGMKSITFKGNAPQILELRMATKERNWEAARRFATQNHWRSCIMVYEAWLGLRPPPGLPDTRVEAIVFHGEARGCKIEVRMFSIVRMPDETIRVGKEIERGESSNYSGFGGPIFEQLGDN